VNVTRHPYSFIGDSKASDGAKSGGLQGVDKDGKESEPTETWHDGLLGYMGGSHTARDSAEKQMAQLGLQAGINFNYNVLTQWQPVKSQRLLLWAGRYGLQEEFMTNLNHRHFEQKQSASITSTLLEAAAEVGLDVEAAAAFLKTDELVDVVWKSYGSTIARGIHSIPLFVFNVPSTGAVGGPFREGQGSKAPYTVHGSSSAEAFLQLFEQIAGDAGVVLGPRTAALAPVDANSSAAAAESNDDGGGGSCSL